MFKGTKTMAPGEFSHIVSSHGGRDNAYTGFDGTGYHQTIAADQLELVMRMEADRMANLVITEKELVPERQVVLEERRMRLENVPAELLDEKVRVDLFGQHRPYSMPTIGYVEDIDRLTAEDLAAFYRQHYAPNNATLVIAGDTTTEAVHKLADTYYGPIARRDVGPARTRPSDGGQGMPQRVVREDTRVAEPSWGQDYLAPSYHVGETKHAYALQVLSVLFGNGETSRLWRSLVVDGRVALSAGSGYTASSLGLSSFGIDVHPAPQETIASVEGAVADQIKRLLDNGVSDEEVARAKQRLLTGAIYAQDSLGSGPRLYSASATTGGTPDDVVAWPDRIAQVSASAVTDAARHVLRADCCVTSLLSPASPGNTKAKQ
jgi:zinc protease